MVCSRTAWRNRHAHAHPYALTYPERVASNQVDLDWVKLKRLDFEKFPRAVTLACGWPAKHEKGGAWPALECR